MDDLTVLERLRVAIQDIEDSKRTIYCAAEDYDTLLAAIDQLPMRGLLELKASQVCPKGTMYVMDHNAMEATMRQGLQRGVKEQLWPRMT